MNIELAGVLLNESNKIKAEEQDTEKLGKLCSEKKACGQWLATSCLSGRTKFPSLSMSCSSAVTMFFFLK